jgi:fatty acid desaturase
MPTLRLLTSIFAFSGVLAGCFAVVLLLALMWRFPPLMLALLAACWLFSLLPEYRES